MLSLPMTMSVSTDKSSTPSVNEDKLEQGVISTNTNALPEPTFTWNNPGPLFKSARRVIIFSLIVWMIFVVLEYFIGIDSYELNWPHPVSTSPQYKPHKYKICCIEGFRLMLDPQRELPLPENCGLCLDGPYRTLYEGGALH
ncbi:unnamed protein product [Rhizoctonia solani]|uniref:Transmembrane protein n=3 Tax=Rhizoctonia solani TaxID=456999 RepID=A0A8H3CSP7_9AGAM|nr:transmembrane protein, putative [Rhizoctonia solani AG-3 Rhs1AP]KEP49647.1 putative transmembrane protein [Rhizoctonia solani 123E]CAE6495534.1 unnamed protein product [Rhizoctonia solani]CAE6519130.1 unnamed protein product [Rhizoctonia solani]